MKRVVLNQVPNINICDVRNTAVIGVKTHHYPRQKAEVIKTLVIQNQSKFFERKIKELDTNHEFTKRYESLEELIRMNIESGHEVFVFDSWNEFYLWAAED